MDQMVRLEIRIDDLTGAASRSLVARHLHGMHETSPPESVFALDVDRLVQPGVSFWTAWDGGVIAGMGALKQLDDHNGEIKSMRVADDYLGKRVGRAVLHHVLGAAQGMKLKVLWLETGSVPAFIPAQKLYESEGFTYCGPFGDYLENPFSRFMTKAL